MYLLVMAASIGSKSLGLGGDCKVPRQEMRKWQTAGIISHKQIRRIQLQKCTSKITAYLGIGLGFKLGVRAD